MNTYRVSQRATALFKAKTWEDIISEKDDIISQKDDIIAKLEAQLADYQKNTTENSL